MTDEDQGTELFVCWCPELGEQEDQAKPYQVSSARDAAIEHGRYSAFAEDTGPIEEDTIDQVMVAVRDQRGDRMLWLVDVAMVRLVTNASIVDFGVRGEG